KWENRAMLLSIQTAVIFCIIGCILILILKQYHKAQGVLLSIAVCSMVLLAILPEVRQIFETAENIYSQSSLQLSYFTILCKAVGISYLTQLGIDICKDCGEQALSTVVELCGRVFLILLALPLFVTLAQTVLELMNT
ncbi:MAG: hypothetical protein K2H82_06900, partial [Oscillospiraceae bacterium]|nr:hypothetical protein [Oscillospiraceae bacterium]